MSGSLIINARHLLPWYRRLFSDASTAMMWGAWLWLWTPVLKSSAWVVDFGLRSYPSFMNLVASGSAEDLQHSFVALVGTSGTLLAWSRLPSRKARASAPAPSVRDYARHFALREHELHLGRRASVCVVHHDDSGRIVRLETRDPAGQPQALAG
jgi:poly-beta-1,6-N-acetyl-D-glucosamine biosynthesis protein PgaD